MSAATSPACSASVAMQSMEPFVHVADVERSLAFYALLGFTRRGSMNDALGRTCWASARSARAEIMFARADPDPVPEQQAVLFYMYSKGVAGLRAHLLKCGLHDGGAYCGAKGPNDGRRVVFVISHPDYMKGGELRIGDPDGYCILVGQLE